MSGPAAAPIPPSALMIPKARARDSVPLKYIVARMYTGGMRSAVPTPSKIELPRMRMPSPGDRALMIAPIPYRVRPMVKQRLRPQRSVSFPHGIMSAAMTSRNTVIAVCTP